MLWAISKTKLLGMFIGVSLICHSMLMKVGGDALWQREQDSQTDLAFKFNSIASSLGHLGACHFSLSLHFLNHQEVSKRNLFYHGDTEIHDIFITKQPTHSRHRIITVFSWDFWPWNVCPFIPRGNTVKYVTVMVKSQLCWEGKPRFFITGLRIKVGEVWESIRECTVL